MTHTAQILARAGKLVLQAGDFRMFLRVQRSSDGQLFLQLVHVRLRSLNRRDARGGRSGSTLAHYFDLPLDIRESILFAVELIRERLELTAQPVDRLHVGVHLVGKPPHVRLLLDSKLVFEIRKALLADLYLLAEDLRRVFTSLDLTLRVLLDEDVRDPVRDPLRPNRLAVRVSENEAVDTVPGVRLRDRVRHRDILFDVRAQPLRHLVYRNIRIEALFADHALQHRGTQELLRDGALPFLPVERAHALEQFRRQRRRGHPDNRLRQILTRQQQRQCPAHDDAEGERHDEPPHAAAHHRDVIERMKGTFLDHGILTGWEMAIWAPTRLRWIRPPGILESWRENA